MMLKVIHHLSKVMRKSLEIDRSGYWRPPEVIMGLLVVAHFDPEVGARLLHDSLDQVRIVPIEDLVFEKTAVLSLR